MATLTNEQIEQKKQLLAEKVKEMKALTKELMEAGAIELSEDELGGVAGGGAVKNGMPTPTSNYDWYDWVREHPELWYEDLTYLLDQ